MKRALLLSLLLLGCGRATQPSAPPTQGKLSPELRAIVEAPRWAAARWGIEVVDLASGEVIYELRPTEKFLTGSTAKIFSVTAALAELGADHRFETPVLHTGSIDAAGKLQGDLVLVATGDLTLGGRTKPDGTVDVPFFDHTDANALPGFATLTPEDPLAGLDDLARQVKKAGVNTIEGEVLVDARLWDLVVLDDVPITPMVVNDNLVDVVIAPGASAGTNATLSDWRPKTAAYAPAIDVKTTAAGSPIKIEIVATGSKLQIQGSVPAGTTNIVQTYQAPEPGAFARTLFIEALVRAGVTVSAAAVAANPVAKLPTREAVAKLPKLATFTSPFVEHAKLINKVSHNLGANQLPLLLAARKGKRTLEEGMELERAYVRSSGVDASLFTLVDGQGLPGNAVAPRAQTKFLQWLPSRPEFPHFFDSTPVLGVDGSLVSVVPKDDPAVGRVHAKTGTLVTEKPDKSIVLQTKALAGYVDAKSGRRFAFALYLNDLPIQKFPDDILAANEALGRMASLLYQSL